MIITFMVGPRNEVLPAISTAAFRVKGVFQRLSRLNGFCRPEKRLKPLPFDPADDTGLKPGANEKRYAPALGAGGLTVPSEWTILVGMKTLTIQLPDPVFQWLDTAARQRQKTPE